MITTDAWINITITTTIINLTLNKMKEKNTKKKHNTKCKHKLY